ncbi:MAG: hypothetical protein WC682_05160 [Parcubacteria group bacterium]|jgi:hypothetical protein
MAGNSILENTIKEKVEELLAGKHWRRICLLILSLAPSNKWSSRNFIYDKLEEWDFAKRAIKLLDDDRIHFLKVISNTLYHLHSERLVKKEDLSRLDSKKFEKFCTKNMIGIVLNFGQHRIQSAYKLSSDGKRKVKELCHPSQQKKTIFRIHFKKRRMAA